MTITEVDLTNSAKIEIINQIAKEVAEKHALAVSYADAYNHNVHIYKVEDTIETYTTGMFRKKTTQLKSNRRINAITVYELSKYYWVFRVIPDSIEYDDIARELAERLAVRFKITLELCNPKLVLPHGSINCQYCGKQTDNLERCVNCGGKPI